MISNTFPGSIILQSWLTKNGISPSLSQKYVANNWLNKLRAGVFFRPGRQPEWQDIIHSLQIQKELPVHLAGISSLAYQGKAHYLQLDQDTIWVAVNNKSALPTWFKSNNDYQWYITSNSKIKNLTHADTCQTEIKNTTITASSVELATLVGLGSGTQLSFI